MSNRAMSFGKSLDQAPIATATATSISASLLFAREMFRDRRFRGSRQVIDISGNGTNNSGPPLAPVRDLLVSEGIIINGLPLTWSAADNADSMTFFGKSFLERYYEECVIGGPGAFSIVVNDISRFQEAVRLKLLTEIAERETLVRPASFEPADGAGRLRGPMNCPLNAPMMMLASCPQLRRCRARGKMIWCQSSKGTEDHPMSLHVRTERALEACYDALIVPELWPTALQQLADALSVSSCTFVPIGDRPVRYLPMSPRPSRVCRILVSQSATTRRARITGKAFPFVSNYVIDDQVVTAEDRKTMAIFPRDRRTGESGMVGRRLLRHCRSSVVPLGLQRPRSREVQPRAKADILQEWRRASAGSSNWRRSWRR